MLVVFAPTSITRFQLGEVIVQDAGLSFHANKRNGKAYAILRSSQR
jgi:hypothetical protein